MASLSRERKQSQLNVGDDLNEEATTTRSLKESFIFF